MQIPRSDHIGTICILHNVNLIVPHDRLIEADAAADLEAFYTLGAAVAFAAVLVAVVSWEAVVGGAAVGAGYVI